MVHRTGGWHHHCLAVAAYGDLVGVRLHDHLECVHSAHARPETAHKCGRTKRGCRRHGETPSQPVSILARRPRPTMSWNSYRLLFTRTARDLR
jgi:hypothetical protein